jgi:N,N-dimethylformamidase
MIEHVGTGRYRIPDTVDGSRLDLAIEFLRRPIGRHSEELQLILARMRSDTEIGRMVLLRDRHGRLVVAEPSAGRGERWRELAEVVDPAEAERVAFALRWEAHTGVRLPAGPQAASTSAGTQDRATVRPVESRRILLGYADPLSVTPGEVVSCHLSAGSEVTAEVDIVRMRSGDDDPAGPGLRYEPVESDAGGRYSCAPQTVHPGSYATARLGGVPVLDVASLQVSFCPTLIRSGEQALLSVGIGNDDGALSLLIGPDMRPKFLARQGGSEGLTCELETRCSLWTWYTLVGTWTPTGLACRLYKAPEGDLLDNREIRGMVAVAALGEQVVIGAQAAAGTLAGRPDVTDHFNGRLEQPAVVLAQLDDDEVRALALPGRPVADLPAAIQERLVGWWDFSEGIETWSVLDRGPHRVSGTIVNLARRAVTGSRWSGEITSWTSDPSQFAAVHFLCDGLEDCGWPATVTWRIPEYLRSGFYAFRVRACGDEDFVPFFVRRAAGAAARPVLLLVPSATYLSYGNSRFWWEDPIQEAVQDRLVELGQQDQYLMVRPEIGPSAYDTHLDGTDVTHVSHRRPNLFMRPGNRHFEGYVSDLYLVDWLEQNGVDYEVALDDDLHKLGLPLLDGVRVVITGTHPEYISSVEYDALVAFQDRGGRLMYLGGNGIQSRINFSPDRPWVMENRRVPYWKSAHPGVEAEMRLASDGLPAGHLSSVGREATLLVGVETATMGFDESRPFRLADGLPGWASFVFDGVKGPELGEFGRLGGGVVGQEWDNAAVGKPLPEEHVVLASSHDHSMIPPLFGTIREPYHCDMVLVARPSGGACWSVGTMAWCGALSHNGYDNDVARVTKNVLQRFLHPESLK